MLLHASKLDLKPPPSSPSRPSISSLLFEPFSRSLALLLSDASLLLYHSLSAAPTLASPPSSTAAAFLRLLPSPSAPARALLLSASPHAGGSAILLRAWTLLPSPTPARLSFKRDRRRPALVLDLPHGHAVRLATSVNVLVLHSLAAARIWVMAAKADGGNEDGGLNLVKCAVIECTAPIYSVTVSMGFLLLGEVGGVRAFPLRPLIKRRPSGARIAAKSSRRSLPNGLVIPAAYAKRSMLPAGASTEQSGTWANCCNGGKCEGTADKDRACYKIKTLKTGQTSGDLGSFFVFIESDICNRENGTGVVGSPKAVSIHALSQKKFLVLDSVGQLHLLCLNDIVILAEAPDTFPITSTHAKVYHLDYKMKVQMLAVLPDISARPQVVWISDGGHSVHMMSLSDVDAPVNDNEDNEKAVQIVATQAIFTSEKIQDIVPLAASAILVLGEGSIFTYAVA